VTVLAIGEGWTAVFAGLIPIIGLGAIGYLIVRAIRDSDDG
jgi:hypothetical protein